MSLRVGLFGAGIVGGGVVELVNRCRANGRFAGLGASIEIAKICVRSKDKPRDFSVGPETTIVTDYNDILKDPSINCVVELMGGVTNAKDVVFAALKEGKHVVTANKALIASFLPEIQQLLALNPTARFAYEAAVCGGIPIIHTLHTDFVADSIQKIMGIMNGTTNYMLCKMEDEGAEYSEALQEAQRLGYAEADPTADVEGHDVQAKIALLAKLAFGKTVPVETIPTTGISKIAKVDFEYARTLRSTIKLLGTAHVNADGSLAVFVSPTMVPLVSPLSAAKGPGNMVMVHSDNLVTSSFAGPGAGRFATANSVLNDMVRLSLNQSLHPFPFDYEEIRINNDYMARFYVRIKCSDGLGIIKSVGEAAEKASVSIHAILQNPIQNHDDLDFVVTTEDVLLSKVQEFVREVGKMSFAKQLPIFMPIMSKL